MSTLTVPEAPVMLLRGFITRYAGNSGDMAQRFRRYDFSGVALIVAGFVLVALVVAGYAIGAALDRHFGTSPRWALVGLLIGFIAGFLDLFLLASRFLANQPKITTATPPEAWDEPEKPEDE